MVSGHQKFRRILKVMSTTSFFILCRYIAPISKLNMLYKYLQSYVILGHKFCKSWRRNKIGTPHQIWQCGEATLKILDGKIKQTFLCHRFSHVRTFEIILCKSNHFKFMISYSSKALYRDIRVRESEWLKEGGSKSHSTSREVSK